jgi:hypothetical protein
MIDIISDSALMDELHHNIEQEVMSILPRNHVSLQARNGKGHADFLS